MGTNLVVLIGRLTKDPELRYTTTDKPTAVASFFLAVERWSSAGNKTDFIRCKAFGKTAEVLDKYCGKGKQICLIGEIRTGDFVKDGNKNYLTEVVAQKIEMLGTKNDKKETESEVQEKIPDGFAHLEDDIPFE